MEKRDLYDINRNLTFGLVYLLRMTKINALVAFLLAGVLSGPYVFNLFELSETWTFLGELGVMFLWFNIGLEINIRRLFGICTRFMTMTFERCL